MRARWVIWIAGAGVVLAVAAVLLIPTSKDRGVSAWLLASTNNVQTLIATNDTPHLYYVGAVAAVPRLSTNVMQQLPPHASIEIQVVVPADARQIMFMYSRMETGQLEHWIKAARALLGLQRSGMRKMYIDLP